jgi:NAD(P)-dependent dehydrogenase (short-subunit alcohol dehydrogenase family)
MDLTNKVALITGGSKGIGLGVAIAMLNEGMKVCITSRSQADLDRVVSEINNPNLIAAVCDVTDLKAQENCVTFIENKFGKLDVLIANAGVGHLYTIETLTPEMWKETIDTNLTGVFNSTKATLPMLKKSEGYIITIASLAGTNFFEKGSAYNASKFGLVGFTQAIMLDLRKYGIKVTTIMPGSVATNFNDHVPSEADAWKIQPEDIGQMVIDLLKMNPRTLPSKIEVRPTTPGGRK